jgi:hypothetical protein
VNLYWIEEAGTSATTYTCVADNCNAAMSIWAAPPLIIIADIAVDDTNVYWAIQDNGSTDAGVRGLIMTCPKVGCTEPTIVGVTASGGAQTLAVDDTNVYFGGELDGVAQRRCSSPPPSQQHRRSSRKSRATERRSTGRPSTQAPPPSRRVRGVH